MAANVRALFALATKDTGWAAIKRAVLQLKHGDSYARAGVIGESAKADHGGGLRNVDLAVIHEFGAPAAGIPERSFIRAPFAANRQKYLGNLGRAIAGVYKGKLPMRTALLLVADQMASDQRKAIAAGIPPPNSPATIKRKGSSKPLIDTGQLRQSLASDVVLGGKRE